jgi:hypothetical protein
MIMRITYVVDFLDGQQLVIPLDLDPSTLALQQNVESPPEWTKLEFEQCPNCPLDPEVHEYCPIAVNMSGALMVFNDYLSYEMVNVTIETSDRRYQKKVALQDAVSSLIGIIMATSGCPVMDHLRPMVRTHLPFASRTESVYRVISMYLMAQYFRKQRGMEPDWDLKHLVELYDEIGKVNHAFSNRMFAQYEKDANINALVILKYVAELLTGSLQNNNLDNMESIFATWLKEEGKII